MRKKINYHWILRGKVILIHLRYHTVLAWYGSPIWSTDTRTICISETWKNGRNTRKVGTLTRICIIQEKIRPELLSFPGSNARIIHIMCRRLLWTKTPNATISGHYPFVNIPHRLSSVLFYTEYINEIEVKYLFIRAFLQTAECFPQLCAKTSKTGFPLCQRYYRKILLLPNFLMRLRNIVFWSSQEKISWCNPIWFVVLQLLHS